MMLYINLWAAVIILLLHWIFDFVCQTHYQSINKSKRFSVLLSHTLTYSGLWACIIFLLVLALNKPIELLWFIPITFIAHTITDYLTSKLNAKLWRENKVHEFFVSIGFDQWLHCAQLLITYQLLNQL